MSRMTSPSLQRRYPVVTICRLLGLSRATLHRQHVRTAASDLRAPRRRGPQGAASDTDLLAAIQEVIGASPFTGEGYRKVWARLRVCGLRTTARRVRRLMKEHGLLAPHWPAPRAAHPHDGKVVTERVDQVWDEPACATGSSETANDMTETFTTAEGRAYVFVAVDHCSGEFVGIHAASGASRREVLDPIRQGVARHFGALDRSGVARVSSCATTTARMTCRVISSARSSSWA
ncbi:IS3 family transposase [Paracoccus benzoatiresistens]|uniref:IS3 family transposase n=1 Tax=Paracoccus benzoatiresistens TaxID=2997341 RepID=A0ABT4JB82_9RHOB|nr:IS3 family transposase [Paracoccus sp. EF6]MCZ0964398.1 IS3 family transposase [Paracoccus sp. EF6]